MVLRVRVAAYMACIRNFYLFLLAVRDSQRAARHMVAVKHKPLFEWFQLPIP